MSGGRAGRDGALGSIGTDRPVAERGCRRVNVSLLLAAHQRELPTPRHFPIPHAQTCRYCEFVRQQVGSPDAIIPPRPPLTRYKREIAVQVRPHTGCPPHGG